MRHPIKPQLCYIITDESHRHMPWRVKIGTSADPTDRSKKTPGQTAERHVVLGQFEDYETVVHQDLKDLDLWLTKEWFLWENETVTYLVGRHRYLTGVLPPVRDRQERQGRPASPVNRIGNPGSLAEKTDWIGDPEGRCAKWMIYLRAVQLVGYESGADAWLMDNTVKWATGAGITEAGLHAQVEWTLPGFFSRWPARVGQCHNRLYYAFRVHPNGGGSGELIPTISGEHPLRSKALKPFAHVAAQVFHGRKRLTAEDARKLFSFPDEHDLKAR